MLKSERSKKIVTVLMKWVGALANCYGFWKVSGRFDFWTGTGVFLMWIGCIIVIIAFVVRNSIEIGKRRDSSSPT